MLVGGLILAFLTGIEIVNMDVWLPPGEGSIDVRWWWLRLGIPLCVIGGAVWPHTAGRRLRKIRSATPRHPNKVCPCCGHRTLIELAAFEICPVCFWEDDGQTDSDADEVRGGPNRDLSLTQARRNYREFGASDRERLARVRPPRPDEQP
jgi:hypothetical protein